MVYLCFQQMCNLTKVDNGATVEEPSDCDNDPYPTHKQDLYTAEISNCPDSILDLSDTFCGIKNDGIKGVKDKQFPLNEKDKFRLVSDSSEYFKDDSVEATKCQVSSCYHDTSLLSQQGCLNPRTSPTLSKTALVPDNKQLSTQKKGLSEITDKPDFLKVSKKDCGSDPFVSKQTNDRTRLIISKPIEYYLQLKANG